MKTSTRKKKDSTRKVSSGRISKTKKSTNESSSEKIPEPLRTSSIPEENGFEDIISRQREIFNKELSGNAQKVRNEVRKKGRPKKTVDSKSKSTDILNKTTIVSSSLDVQESPEPRSIIDENRIESFIIEMNNSDKENTSFKCGICLKVLPSKADMNKHVSTHIGERRYKCGSCDAAFSEKVSLEKHMTTHTVDKPIKQFLAETRAASIRTRDEFEDTIDEESTRPEKKRKISPKKSSKTKKSEKEAAKAANKDSSAYVICLTKEVDGVTTKSFKCRICSKETSAKADLVKHIRVHTGERPFKCKVCDASFVQITALRGHETIHTGEKPFACDLCGKKFAIKDRLRLHMRIHTGEKPHHCSICNQAFGRRSQVSQHMRTHSTSKEVFKCEECDSSFASYHTLKAHINTHRGIKEFQCPTCGKKFLRVEGMYKHIRTVHRGNRPYLCGICGKAFKGHLQQHMRLHMGIRPFSCHLCEASFTQNSQLTVHLRIHTGERPYKCQVCGSSFAHSSACKIHMRSHTGEKPFNCVICNQAFSQLPHLKKHMKCVHRADKPYMCIVCKEFFQTQEEIDAHKRFSHNVSKTAEEEAQDNVEESTLARLRNRLAVLLYRISSDDRRSKFGFGQQLVDEVLKLSLQSSGHTPISDSSLTRLDELRQNVFLLLRWTIPKETMEEYHRNNMTVDEVLDMLTS